MLCGPSRALVRRQFVRSLSTARTQLPGSSVSVASLLVDSSRRLGRPLSPTAADELAAALSANWFDSPAALTSLAVEDAMQMGLPSRLIRDVQECLRSGQALGPVWAEGGGEDEGAAAKTSSTPQAATNSPAPLATAAGTEPSEGPATAAAAPCVGDVRIRATARYLHRDRHDPASTTTTTPTTTAAATAKAVRLTRRAKLPPYRLLPLHSTPAVEAELGAFEGFLTQRFLGQQEPRVAPVTARKYVDLVRGALGWLHRERGVPLEELALAKLIPGAERADVHVAFAHIVWLEEERGVSPATEATALRALIAVAKHVLHAQSQSDVARGDKPYHDVPLIAELRRLANDAKARWRVAPAVADEGAKWMGWPTYLHAVEALREEALAGRDAHGRLRSRRAVAWSLQQYLIFSILACIPDRQRTLRELRLGRTLVRDGGGGGGGGGGGSSVGAAAGSGGDNGGGGVGVGGVEQAGGQDERFWIKHTAADYKTGKDYGDRPPMLIAPALSPMLCAWADQWRAELAPAHDFFFTQKNGEPFSATSLGQMFANTAYRLTGHKTNPHLVRDMIVTHLRSSDASERELEALAIFMGHSLATQKDSYDRRSKAEKVAPAVSLLQSTNAAALLLNASAAGPPPTAPQ